MIQIYRRFKWINPHKESGINQKVPRVFPRDFSVHMIKMVSFLFPEHVALDYCRLAWPVAVVAGL